MKDRYPHPGIYHKASVGGDVGGILLVVAVVLILVRRMPEARLFMLASLGLAIVIALFLRIIRR